MVHGKLDFICLEFFFFWCRGIHDYPPLTIKSIPCECSSLGGWNVDCNVRKMLQQWYATKTEDRDSCRIYHVESVNKEQVVTFNYCESGQILQNHHWRISPICLSIYIGFVCLCSKKAAVFNYALMWIIRRTKFNKCLDSKLIIMEIVII